ncbi:MAG: T9SS type A sorting domain-containing protein [Candidatus Cloacimonetes bacterium]|nr:T9SS type A sorting domain-containing protein [Candidatus Cloacimonadota bacterium]
MKNLLILLVLFTALTLNAQIQWTEEVPVRQGVNIEWSRAAVPVDGGNVVYVWSDTRFGDRDLWAQKMDANGNRLWGEEALLVNGEINRQEDPVVIDVGGGNVIIAWVDFRNEDDGDIYVQKLNSNGDLLWNSAGVPLCLAEEIQISLNIVSDNSGGAYVIWIDNRNGVASDIYGTHILSSGNIASGWNADGNPITDEEGNQNQHTFWEDGTGGAIMVWHHKLASDEDIYAQRISSDGNLLWGGSGVLVCGAANEQETPKMAPDGSGNFIISWRDKRSDEDGDIYAQRIDINGNLLWGSDVSVYSGSGVQENPRITESSDNGAIIIWQDGRNESSTDFTDIYSQKIDLNGNLDWSAAAVPIAIELYDQENPRLIGDDSGGAWITWEDGRIENHPFGDIYTQHINSTGNVLLTPNGKNICNATNWQFAPLIKKAGNNIFLVWGDNRTGSTGIYLQVMDSSANTLLDDNGELIYYGLCGDARDYMFMTNGNEKAIIWKDTRNSSIAIQTYMQILNNDGSFGLIDNGQPITNMTGYNQEYLDACFPVGTDIIAVVWNENRTENNNVFAQAVSVDGSSLWDNGGLALCSVVSSQDEPKIAYDGNNFYAAWTDYNLDLSDPVVKVAAQKIDAGGSLLWGTEGITIADLPYDDVIKDVVGRYFIWENRTPSDYNIYAKLIDENGNTAAGWEDNGNLICSASGNQTNPRGIIVPEGLLIIWEDPRDVNLEMDIYGQVITEEGNTLWQDDGIPLVSIEEEQMASNMIYDNGLFLVWKDFRNGVDTDIYMQKYDENGTEIWQDNGIEVVSKANSQEDPYMTYNGENFMIFWEDYAGGSESALYGQMINSTGNTQWPSNGYLICNDIKGQNNPRAISDNDYAYVIWEDTRSSGKTDIYNIYAQKIEYILVDVDDNEINPNENKILCQNYPNPFNPETTIQFSTTEHTENTELIIYNIKGQKVKTLYSGIAEEGKHTVTWNGKDTNDKSVSSGIYFYKLKTGKQELTRKMLLLK